MGYKVTNCSVLLLKLLTSHQHMDADALQCLNTEWCLRYCFCRAFLRLKYLKTEEPLVFLPYKHLKRDWKNTLVVHVCSIGTYTSLKVKCVISAASAPFVHVELGRVNSWRVGQTDVTRQHVKLPVTDLQYMKLARKYLSDTLHLWRVTDTEKHTD